MLILMTGLFVFSHLCGFCGFLILANRIAGICWQDSIYAFFWEFIIVSWLVLTVVTGILSWRHRRVSALYEDKICRNEHIIDGQCSECGRYLITARPHMDQKKSEKWAHYQESWWHRFYLKLT